MMVDPQQPELEQEELYEIVLNDVTGERFKVTAKNSNGRKCGECGCSCPCSCKDCKPFCCSRITRRKRTIERFDNLRKHSSVK